MTSSRFKKLLSLLLLLVITSTMTLSFCGCTDNTSTQTIDENNFEPIGEGASNFLLTVTDSEGNVSGFKVSSDEKTVGDALSSLGIISGEEGPYGLYVKTVNGITVDFDRDKKYWAFYIDDTYATSGIDKTNIENGAHYALKVSK